MSPSCAIGPWIRLFTDDFRLADLMRERVECRVVGADGFETSGANDLSQITRSPTELVRQATGGSHQYPDGFVPFPGTMYIPTEDRREPGRGFTHEPGDRVEIARAPLGTLIDWVAPCEQVPPWRLGIPALYEDLSARGLLPLGILALYEDLSARGLLRP